MSLPSRDTDMLLAEKAGAAVREAAISLSAPLALRERIEAERTRARPAARRRRFAGLGGVGATVAAAALALVIALPGGSPAGPALAEAAGRGLRAPSAVAPRPTGPGSKLLAAEVDGVPFPDWAAKFGWRATGRRDDTIDGRGATTVYYENAKGRRLAYTILAGDPLPEPDAPRFVREGTVLRAVVLDGRQVVTWRRDGRTCLLGGRDVPREKLLELAAWRGKGGVPSED